MAQWRTWPLILGNKNQEARGGSRQRASGGATTLLSSRQLGLLPGERNSKIAASATATIGLRDTTVNCSGLLSPLSTPLAWRLHPANSTMANIVAVNTRSWDIFK